MGSKIAVRAGNLGGRFLGGVGAINIPWNAIWSKIAVEESERYGMTPKESIYGQVA
jgi:hypothetical protein